MPISPGAAPHSQTLSKGLTILEILAAAGSPMSITELAQSLGVHRSVAYRILRTLEDHNLIARDTNGGVRLGARLGELAQAVSRDLQAAALPELTSVADDLTMTSFLAVLEGQESVVLTSVEPRQQAATIVYRPGSRHPITHGAPGLAIQATLTDAQWNALYPGISKRPELTQLREAGYISTRGEVIRGMAAVAAPVLIPGGGSAAIAVVYVETELGSERIGQRLVDGASRIERALSLS